MSPTAANTAALCRAVPATPTRSTRPRARLTDVEIEILVRLVGYGCPPEKAARYLERPTAMIGRELARLGLARSAEEQRRHPPRQGGEGGEPC